MDSQFQINGLQYQAKTDLWLEIADGEIANKTNGLL